MKYCNSAVTDILQALPESVTVCATVDESGHEHVITELMVRRACEQMDGDQIWPYTTNEAESQIVSSLPPRNGYYSAISTTQPQLKTAARAMGLTCLFAQPLFYRLAT